MEEIFGGQQFECHHKGLVPVISRPEVAILKGACHSQLGKFLAIAEYTELRFPGEYLPPSQYTAFPAGDSYLIIPEYLCPEVIEGNIIPGFKLYFFHKGDEILRKNTKIDRILQSLTIENY
jgi:hypothetical protein